MVNCTPFIVKANQSEYVAFYNQDNIFHIEMASSGMRICAIMKPFCFCRFTSNKKKLDTSIK